MGFLDHSANNIIVDAVLTSLGRKKLANSFDTFKVAQFALADDEIDYGVIEKYGRTVGKEKIEKNTPVLEAFTRGSLGLKNKLVTLSSEFSYYMPNFVTTTKTADGLLNFSNTIGTTTLSIEIKMEKDGLSIPRDIRDREILVHLDNRFLFLNQPFDLLTSDNIAIYTVQTTPDASGFTVSIPINRRNVDDTTFNLYSIANGNPAYIRSFIRIEGFYSGISKVVEAKIEKC